MFMINAYAKHILARRRIDYISVGMCISIMDEDMSD